jgi:hypothetical protein
MQTVKIICMIIHATVDCRCQVYVKCLKFLEECEFQS